MKHDFKGGKPREFWAYEIDGHLAIEPATNIKPFIGNPFLVREITAHDEFKAEALAEAYNTIQAITEYGETDCLCCKDHERIALEWIKKYGIPEGNADE